VVGWVVLLAALSAVCQFPAVFAMLRPGTRTRGASGYGPGSGEVMPESFGDRFADADGFTKVAVVISISGALSGAGAAILAASMS
jgi:hypothetical protein